MLYCDSFGNKYIYDCNSLRALHCEHPTKENSLVLSKKVFDCSLPWATHLYVC